MNMCWIREGGKIEVCNTKLAIIISYPKSVSGIIILFKTPPKNRTLRKINITMPPELTHTLNII